MTEQNQSPEQQANFQSVAESFFNGLVASNSRFKYTQANVDAIIKSFTDLGFGWDHFNERTLRISFADALDRGLIELKPLPVVAAPAPEPPAPVALPKRKGSAADTLYLNGHGAPMTWQPDRSEEQKKIAEIKNGIDKRAKQIASALDQKIELEKIDSIVVYTGNRVNHAKTEQARNEARARNAAKAKK